MDNNPKLIYNLCSRILSNIDVPIMLYLRYKRQKENNIGLSKILSLYWGKKQIKKETFEEYKQILSTCQSISKSKMMEIYFVISQVDKCLRDLNSKYLNNNDTIIVSLDHLLSMFQTPIYSKYNKLFNSLISNNQDLTKNKLLKDIKEFVGTVEESKKIVSKQTIQNQLINLVNAEQHIDENLKLEIISYFK